MIKVLPFINSIWVNKSNEHDAYLKGNTFIIPFTYRGKNYTYKVPFFREHRSSRVLCETKNGEYYLDEHLPALPIIVKPSHDILKMYLVLPDDSKSEILIPVQ